MVLSNRNEAISKQSEETRSEESQKTKRTSIEPNAVVLHLGVTLCFQKRKMHVIRVLRLLW